MSAQPRGDDEFLTDVEHPGMYQPQTFVSWNSKSGLDPLGALPPDLENERQKLEEIFTVDTATLQRITERFGQELQQGVSL